MRRQCFGNGSAVGGTSGGQVDGYSSGSASLYLAQPASPPNSRNPPPVEAFYLAIILSLLHTESLFISLYPRSLKVMPFL